MRINEKSRMRYNAGDIERKWKKKWKEDHTYKVELDQSMPKYYVLDMFPYPSGSGLHVGHPLGYIASDIISRYKRHRGFNVLHPMGFDAFGLPAEQYAITHGIHPAVSTEKNIKRYKEQLENIGLCYDWSREVRTSDPSYYKWTQWIFSKLFGHYYDSKMDKALPISNLEQSFTELGSAGANEAYGNLKNTFSADEWQLMTRKEKEDILMSFRLAYRKQSHVNWCEALGTVLANDEVKDGYSERGNHPVEKRSMLQWSLRTTAYAERLLNGLDDVDWTDSLKAVQRNWIGKSTGANVFFEIKDHLGKKMEVFTTRPDTMFGVTFMVLSPQHPLVAQITTADQQQTINNYIKEAEVKAAREGHSKSEEMTGVFCGAYAIHPFSSKEIPIFISDYVLMDYGTGAIMAVPSDDERDRRFAISHDLPIIEIVERPEEGAIGDKLGIMQNSDFLNGLSIPKAIKLMIAKIEEKGIGSKQIQYKLRDANYSRQRYWGEPFPVMYDQDDIAHLIPDNELPLSLPDLTDFRPASGAKSPLARLDDWIQVDDKIRETDTMPGFAGSSWYFLRYMDPNNEHAIASKECLDYWQDVDVYIGGTEHAVGHLIYSRFWHKFLYDLDIVKTTEPFKKLINQGMILGRSSFVYRANEMMAEHAIEKKFNEYKISVQKNYAVGGEIVDFAIPEEKIAIEIKPATLLIHRQNENRERFEKSGWIYVGLPFEKTAHYWHNFDEVVKLLRKAKNRAELDPIDPNVEMTPFYISADMIKDKRMTSAIHVDVHLVKDDKLDIDAFIKSREDRKNAMFLTNELGQYQCGSMVEKMSKSKLNVVNPDEIIEQYGTDCFRMYEMFLGPIDQSKPWDTSNIEGIGKFINKFWSLFHNSEEQFELSDETPNKEEYKILHTAIKKVQDDINRYSFNTCISAMMIAVNELRKINCNKRDILEQLIILISPFAPHMAEELYELSGQTKTVTNIPYPKFDESYLVSDEIEYPVSINGKKRAMVSFAASLSREEIMEQVPDIPEVKKWVEGNPIKKIIVVPGRMINVVV